MQVWSDWCRYGVIDVGVEWLMQVWSDWCTCGVIDAGVEWLMQVWCDWCRCGVWPCTTCSTHSQVNTPRVHRHCSGRPAAAACHSSTWVHMGTCSHAAPTDHSRSDSWRTGTARWLCRVRNSTCIPRARVTEYLTTILRLSYDDSEVRSNDRLATDV